MECDSHLTGWSKVKVGDFLILWTGGTYDGVGQVRNVVLCQGNRPCEAIPASNMSGSESQEK